MTVGEGAPRIVVFAYSDVGHACLAKLIERGANVVAVVTHEDDPGETRWFASVAELARSAGIPVLTPEEIKSPDSVAQVAGYEPDLVLSFYYRFVLPRAILALPRLGAFNAHGSLLPKLRGRAPVNWAIVLGETTTGATLHVMEPRADAGDIVDQEAVAIASDDTAAEVQHRVTDAAVRVLDRQLDALLAGAAPRRAQDASQATTVGRRRPEDGRIDWSWPARRVHDLVRAVTHPYPGAFGEIFGRKTYVWRTRCTGAAVSGEPGRALVEGGRLVIACGDGLGVEVLRAQVEGAPEVTGAELAAGVADAGATPFEATSGPGHSTPAPRREAAARTTQ